MTLHKKAITNYHYWQAVWTESVRNRNRMLKEVLYIWIRYERKLGKLALSALPNRFALLQPAHQKRLGMWHNSNIITMDRPNLTIAIKCIGKTKPLARKATSKAGPKFWSKAELNWFLQRKENVHFLFYLFKTRDIKLNWCIACHRAARRDNNQ